MSPQGFPLSKSSTCGRDISRYTPPSASARKQLQAVPEDLIGIPLIPKTRRVYQLPDGLHLEVNLVDEGMPTAFMYAEIEYESEDQANTWVPSSPWLGQYLQDEVTEDPAQTMGAFWVRTRLNGHE